MVLGRSHNYTSFVQLDTNKCKACWNCLKNCTNNVIGKVDLPWHKHALILKPDACTGCLSCIDTCRFDSYSLFDGHKQKAKKQKIRILNNFLINNLLFIFGLVVIFSGLVLQVGFHMGGPDINQNDKYYTESQSLQYEQLRVIDISKTVCGFNYTNWSTIHKFIIVCFSLLFIYHTYLHWKWYKGIITKNLIWKNKQVIILAVLFLFVAVTGLIPWFIDLSNSSSILRMYFIEIHDKITFILIFFLILHFIKRFKWYGKTYEKLRIN